MPSLRNSLKCPGFGVILILGIIFFFHPHGHRVLREIPGSLKTGKKVWSYRDWPKLSLPRSHPAAPWISPTFPTSRAGISLPAQPGAFIHKTPLRKKIKILKNSNAPRASCGRGGEDYLGIALGSSIPCSFFPAGRRSEAGKGLQTLPGMHHAGKHREAPGSGLTHSTLKIKLGGIFFVVFSPPLFPPFLPDI